MKKILLLIALLAVPARGEEHARAKVLFQEGTRQYNIGRFRDALAAFNEGYLSAPDPAFLFNIGQCNRMLGSWKEAIHAYRRFLAEQPGTSNRAAIEKYIADAEAELAKEEARPAPAPQTARVAIESSPPGAEVTLDDERASPLGKTPYANGALAPGAHVVFLEKEGYHRVMKAFSVAAGESVRLDLALVPVAPPAPPSPGPPAAAPAPAPAPAAPQSERSKSRVHFVAQAGGGISGGIIANDHGPNIALDLSAGIEIDLLRWLQLRLSSSFGYWIGDFGGQLLGANLTLLFWPVAHWYIGVGGSGVYASTAQNQTPRFSGLVGGGLLDTGLRFANGRFDIGLRLVEGPSPSGQGPWGVLALYLGVRLP